MTRRLLTIAVLTLALGLQLAAPAAAAPSDVRQRAGWTFGRWAEVLFAVLQGGRPLERAFDAEGHGTDPNGAPSSGTTSASGGGQPIDPDASSADGDEGHATDPDGVR